MKQSDKIRVVFYARVSTGHEAQINAFENQIEWYKGELLRHPEWEMVDIYSDKGVTGTSVKKREGFMQMYADAYLGRFDKIVTRELSRFARNVEEAYEYARKFLECGVSILFLNDNINTGNTQDMTVKFALMASLAQKESRKVSTRAKDELERRGRRTAQGKTNWHESNISKVLKNSFYYGILTYHKEYVDSYLHQKRRKNYDAEKFEYAEGRHTPIVTKEEFDLVQSIMAARSVPFQQTRKGNGGWMRLHLFIHSTSEWIAAEKYCKYASNYVKLNIEITLAKERSR